MNREPHWKFLHDGWESDVRFELWCIEKVKEMLIRQPGDEGFLEMIKMLRKRLEWLCVEYKKIYGDRPNIRRMKGEI